MMTVLLFVLKTVALVMALLFLTALIGIGLAALDVWIVRKFRKDDLERYELRKDWKPGRR